MSTPAFGTSAFVIGPTNEHPVNKEVRGLRENRKEKNAFGGSG